VLRLAAKEGPPKEVLVSGGILRANRVASGGSADGTRRGLTSPWNRPVVPARRAGPDPAVRNQPALATARQRPYVSLEIHDPRLRRGRPRGTRGT
jgi:hypothetical protein